VNSNSNFFPNIQIIFKHDASRVIQTCLKYGTDEQRATIVEELKGQVLSLVEGHYSTHLVRKMLKVFASSFIMVVWCFIYVVHSPLFPVILVRTKEKRSSCKRVIWTHCITFETQGSCCRFRFLLE
jgi:hypothetical protein